jgi:hypothetical protein
MAETPNPSPPLRLVALADARHARVCSCGDRRQHEADAEISYLAGVVAEMGTGPLLVLPSGTPPPVTGRSVHTAAVLAAVASVAVQIASALVGSPTGPPNVSQEIWNGVIGAAQIVIVLGAAYGIRPGASPSH